MKPTFALIAALALSFATAADFDIRSYGARTDAASNTKAINAAVKAAAEKGGRVIVPPGRWVTGSVELKSGVELHLAEGAVLEGSLDKHEYNADNAFPGNVWSSGEEWSGAHLVWAYNAENVAITGKGTIDGNGSEFFGECDEDSRWPGYKYGLKLHPLDREWFRPGIMVGFFECRNIRIEDVTLYETTAWSCHLRCCDGVDIKGVTIDADRTIANSDGFSIDCTRNVKVEKCIIRTGDDGFAIRASCRNHASTNFCSNITIKDCDIWSCCFAIRFGIGVGTIRDITVSDVRVHEAAQSAFGFTPAWVNSKRNCYIENIKFTRCRVTDCVEPVSLEYTRGDFRITGISFEDCEFRTLLPPTIVGSEKVGFSFRNCTRHTIERFKVRHRWLWNEKGIRNNRFNFIIRKGDVSRIETANCSPRPLESAGLLLLTFDDRNFKDWENAAPLFRKYGAHATFFISGEVTGGAVSTAKKLIADGHSIGLHGHSHMNATDGIGKFGEDLYWEKEIDTPLRQSRVAYIPTRSFAYPNSRRSARTDEFLLKGFDRLRGGNSARPYDPKGLKRASLKPLVTDGSLFFPVKDIAGKRVIEALAVGEVYNTDIDELVACIRRIGERKETLAIVSHGIHPDAEGIHMKTEWLEKILEAAEKSGVNVLGFGELPVN